MYSVASSKRSEKAKPREFVEYAVGKQKRISGSERKQRSHYKNSEVDMQLRHQRIVEPIEGVEQGSEERMSR